MLIWCFVSFPNVPTEKKLLNHNFQIGLCEVIIKRFIVCVCVIYRTQVGNFCLKETWITKIICSHIYACLNYAWGGWMFIHAYHILLCNNEENDYTPKKWSTSLIQTPHCWVGQEIVISRDSVLWITLSLKWCKTCLSSSKSTVSFLNWYVPFCSS